MSSNRIEIGTINSAELVLVQDASDNLVLEDADGNTILTFNQAQSVTWEDASSDPSSNGEIQRNGADLKAFSGGAVRNLSNIGGGTGMSVTQIDDTDSPYTTTGEDLIVADTSSAAVTVTLATADVSGDPIGVVNINGSNDVTVDTEGSETIDPGGESSKTQSTAGWLVWYAGDGTNWDSSLDADVESIATEGLTIESVDGLTLQTEAVGSSFSFSGGQTRELGIGNNKDLSDVPLLAFAWPANDPDNDHGYVVDSVWWDDSAGLVKVRVTETESAGGGNAGVVMYSVNFST